MHKKNIPLVILFIGYLISISCSQDIVPVEFHRFDKRVFTLRNIDSLKGQYPILFPFYLERILQVKSEDDSLTNKGFELFLETYSNTLYDTIQRVFPDMKEVEKKLSYAFANYKKEFPQDSIPRLYTHISGFNQPVVAVGESILSVSLDDYLGESSYYDKLGIFKYLRNEMYPKQIPLDIMQVLALQKIAPQNATDNLLANMIYQGKIIYFLSRMFPEDDTATLMAYTEEQEEWCESNEQMMWKYIIENKHLFESSYRIIRAYIDKAPFTRGFPQESPARTGVWIGYNIVKKYAKNSGKSLKEIMSCVDYRMMLKISSYNPN